MSKPQTGSLLEGPGAIEGEWFETLVVGDGFRLERILSRGHATPPGEWYDQVQDEWVTLLSGGAGLLFAGEAEPRILKPGDWVHIPARCRHRVEWTAPGCVTVWLALHHAPGDS